MTHETIQLYVPVTNTTLFEGRVFINTNIKMVFFRVVLQCNLGV